MSVLTPPFVQQGGSHPAANFRQMLQGAMGPAFGAFTSAIQATAGGGGNGVAGSTDLAVTQNGTPNMSVLVAAGLGFMRGSENVAQGVYAGCNDASLNVVISAADPTNPRKDLIVMKVRDAFYSGASTDVSVVAVTGTAAASPVDPSVPVNSIVLARVNVAAAASSITNANIDDLRTRAYSVGAAAVCTSSTRPTGNSLHAGLSIYETDTDRVYRYTGSAWRYVSGGNDPTAARGFASAATSVATSQTTIALASESYDYGNNFASNTYTCPRAGLLVVSGAIAFSGLTAGDRLIAAAAVNGTLATSSGGSPAVNAAGTASNSFSDTLAVSSGDTVTLVGFVAGGPKNCTTGAAQTYLSCRMLP